jgi:hypothetical protein
MKMAIQHAANDHSIKADNGFDYKNETARRLK